MPKLLRARGMHYEIIDRFSVGPWTGAPIVLQRNDNAGLPQTPVGSAVLVWVNQTKANNAGQLSWTSGGSVPAFLSAPALQFQPYLLVRNWEGNNLSVTNVSGVPNTPIWVAAYGPGMPGNTPQPLPTNGTTVQLSTLATAQGVTLPRWMQLNLANFTGSLTVFVIIGGPADSSGNNARVISLNDSANTGPGTGVTPPAGYYATTQGNTYSYQLNWQGATVFVAAMSPATSLGASVSLTAL